MFYDNLKAICDEQGVKITPIVDECGGAKGSISNWKKGASPNSDIVAKLAVRLNVSTDLLIFGKEHQVNMNNSFNNNNIAYGNNSKVQVNGDDTENEICMELFKIIRSLPLKERSKLITMIYDFEEQYKKSNT
ncbi:MAG: helix-turn-helix domain-containing protein [Ruminococcus sp.]|nr:helix-turn-helix domain-containing protein [Ruminococcus sp.]MDE6847772.1 helix-turn-helix domain-containing protein [Ruminococcus sp.]MDE7137430.1 helix-turn-helix domain-containing protein [Ruminococcus sp.]